MRTDSDNFNRVYEFGDRLLAVTAPMAHLQPATPPAELAGFYSQQLKAAGIDQLLTVG